MCRFDFLLNNYFNLKQAHTGLNSPIFDLFFLIFANAEKAY